MPHTRSQRALVAMGAVAVAVVVVLAVDPLPGDAPAATTAPDPGSGEAVEAGELRLTVAEPDPARTRYDRDDWMPGGWDDADGNGCSTREEVLTAESRGPPQIDAVGCTIVAGDWVDPFTGLATSSPRDLEIDHLVALADAHRSGGWRWPDERKADFANDLADPDALNAIDGEENQRKADDGPDAWSPGRPEHRCIYVVAYARIKARWDLTVTPAQATAIEDAWAECPISRPPTPPAALLDDAASGGDSFPG